MASKKSDDKQTAMPGVEPPKLKVITVGRAVAAIIDSERHAAEDAKRAADLAITKCHERANKRRERIMDRLATDADRDLAQRMVEPALAAMRGKRFVVQEDTGSDDPADRGDVGE